MSGFKCLVCKKARKAEDFLPEYNLEESYWTCSSCVASGVIYCPIHEQTHAKTLMNEVKFKVGKACPIAQTPAEPSTDFSRVLHLIATKFTKLDTVSEKVDNIEELFGKLVPLLEQVVMLTSAKHETPSSGDSEAINRLTAENQKLKASEQEAMEEMFKAEERATQLQLELEQANASLEALMQSRQGTYQAAKDFQEFLSRFS